MKSKKVSKNKPIKQNWFEEHYILTTIVIGIFVVGLAVYLKYTPKYWCKVNPDKCVCEYTMTNGSQIIAKFDLCEPKTESYNYRKKTQEELKAEALIKSCQDNPREDGDCTCLEEYKLECLNQGIYEFEKDNISFIVKLQPNLTGFKNGSFCYPKPKVIEESGGILKEVIYEDTWIAEQYCIKSHQKTECEKGNPNYRQENKITEVDTSNTGHIECQLQTGWFCPGVGIVNLPCDNNTGECLLNASSLGLHYVGCRYENEICISNQTACLKRVIK